MRAAVLWVLVLIAVLAGCAEQGADHRAARAPSSAGIRFLGDTETRGFERATEARPMRFPQDHGSHPQFRTEWWYFTGNLDDGRGRHFGFELTFFRLALASDPPQRASAWGANQVWMAHFSVTDTAGERFFAAERLARGALDLAGARSEPFRVWVEDWSAAGTATAADLALELRARDGDVSIDLALEAQKPPVAHGEQGLDAKGPEPGNASYYYSLPRLAATGTVSVPGTTADVIGSAWMDREWGTSALSPGVVGWDWFALQLSDGRDLMFYRLRTADGRASPFSGGTLVGRAGERSRLGAADVELTILEHWVSAKTGVRYPVAWRLAVPREQLELEIEPRLRDQEIDLSVRYWEGAVAARGTAAGRPLQATGYLELAGY
jgi:predicted secreted hydrolase